MMCVRVTQTSCACCPWDTLYDAHMALQKQQESAEAAQSRFVPSLRRYFSAQVASRGRNGFDRIETCRQALAALDHCGWQRSFHQRQFHEAYIRACSRVFFKTDGHGAFARYQKQLLELNGWDHIAQEVLVSTPRRFGKTVSISMFAAALIFSTPAVECSIYST